MKKPLLILLYTLITLFLLTVAAVVAMVSLVDPNEYKPVIEQQAKNQAGINLQLDGELSWKLWPLGILISEAALQDRQQQHFAKLGLLTAEIDLLSVFQMRPRVDHIVIDGLDLHLIKDAQGQGNWETLVEKSASADKPDATATTEQTTTEPAQALDFLVETVQITNAKVRYQDLATQQDVLLNPFNLRVDEIALEQDIPVQLALTVVLKEPELKLDLELQTQARISRDMKQIALNDFTADASVLTALLNNKELKSRLQLDLAVDLNTQTLILPRFTLELNQLKTQGQVQVARLDDGPQIQAQLEVAPFALVPLLESLGQTPPPIKQADIALMLETQADLKAQTAQINKLELSLNKLKATATASATQLDTQAQINAVLNVTEFALAELLNALGVELPPMQDNAALAKAALDMQILSDSKSVTLDNLKLRVDDTTVTGSVSHRLEDPFSTLRLNIDQIDLNRYLPPQAEAQAASAQASPKKASKEPITLELPNDPLDLAPLRQINLDADLNIAKAQFKTIAADTINVKLKGKKGLIKVENVSANLLGGSVALQGSADARGETLKVDLKQNATNISADMDLGEYIHKFALQGKTQLNTQLSTEGRSIKTLADNLQLQSDFAMLDGKVTGGNASALTCEGIALVNGESISTSKWPQETDFEELRGQVKMKGLSIDNTAEIKAAKLRLNGEGNIDLNRMYVDYGLTTYILGDLGHEACRYNDKFANVGIPIRCKGDLNGIDAKFCLPDKSKLGDMAKELAKAEAKRKATKELDKVLDKHLGGEENQSKDAVKGLLKKIF